ncbi:uncharacterized protein JCM10292_005824 [Rhodotorula paludigena]|uniref:uncharacterized protein n=1 Tax=Rhodotorula paludigena TaxID=86838 RepID=UPI00317E0858
MDEYGIERRMPLDMDRLWNAYQDLEHFFERHAAAQGAGHAQHDAHSLAHGNTARDEGNLRRMRIYRAAVYRSSSSRTQSPP